MTTILQLNIFRITFLGAEVSWPFFIPYYQQFNLTNIILNVLVLDKVNNDLVLFSKVQ